MLLPRKRWSWIFAHTFLIVFLIIYPSEGTSPMPPRRGRSTTLWMKYISFFNPKEKLIEIIILELDELTIIFSYTLWAKSQSNEVPTPRWHSNTSKTFLKNRKKLKYIFMTILRQAGSFRFWNDEPAQSNRRDPNGTLFDGLFLGKYIR